jgi:hypothetical protein
MRPTISNLTNNIWILDNVLCRQPTWDWGLQGTSGCSSIWSGLMGNRMTLTSALRGNALVVTSGDVGQSFPPHNQSTSKPLRFVNPAEREL